jgi:hypothetical protein
VPEAGKPQLMTQFAPWPDTLVELVEKVEYRPGWVLTLEDIVRDVDRTGGDEEPVAGGLTLKVLTQGYDTYHPDRGATYRVYHYFPVPAATYNEQSWRRWLFERLLDVERHEAAEFFQVGGERPYAPHHGPGNDPYIIFELGSDEARRTSFRGDVKEA